MTPADTPLLEVRDLVVDFHGRGRRHRALDGVGLEVFGGETVAVVGESGAGKSTLGRAVLGLAPVRSGAILFDGRDITHAGHRTRSALASQLSAVFQDPYSSLNPARTVGDSLAEPLVAQGARRGPGLPGDIERMLVAVGLDGEAADRYPRQFSGGQRQRIAIARALMTSPALVICDEPLSALDLSVQAQIINLLVTLRAERGLAYLFIGHDLAVVRHLAQRVVVLRQGRVVETGTVGDVCDRPTDPYTRRLVSWAPVPDPAIQRRRIAELVAAGPAGEETT